MLPEERRHQIVEILNSRSSGTASVAELAERFNVSDMTIRRDLTWLEVRSLVKRVHGGAVTPDLMEKPFAERSTEFDEAKQAIGWAAAQLIEDGDVILLDAGTTTRQVARYLRDKRALTVITNALPVAEALAPYPETTVIVLGGVLKQQELCTVGPTVTRELARFAVDKAFLSAAGFDLEKGVTDPDVHEADVKEAMIRAASQIILVADSSKWHQTALAQVALLEVIETLVTDDEISPEAIAALEMESITVVTQSRLVDLLNQEEEPNGL